MGGMAALIPSRKDPEANERAIEAVAADKEREAGAGFDGTWVAHPDVVQTAMAEFDKVLGDRPNQVDRQRDDVDVGAAELLDVASTPGRRSPRQGLRNNVNVGIQYISSWLRGNGAAGIYGLMEDAATAEISRSQVWQWIRHGRTLEDDGTPITPDLVRAAGGRGARAHPQGDRRRRVVRARGPPEGVARRCSSRSRWPTSSPSSSPSRPTSSSTEPRWRARTSSPAGAAGSAARSSSGCWPTATRSSAIELDPAALEWLDGARARDRAWWATRATRRSPSARPTPRRPRRRSPAGSTTPRSSATHRSTRRPRASCWTSSR